MAAAPQSGTFVFAGLQTGRNYNKDVYCSDVANALINWDVGQGAGSGTETFWTAPESCVIVDFTQVTGMTDTVSLQVTVNGVPTGDIIRFANHLNTLNSRPILNIPVPAGGKVSCNQLA